MTLLSRIAVPAVIAGSLLASPAFAADKMTLILDWFVNPDHAPIKIAEARGFFAEEGLEVEVVEPADPSDPPKLVAAGKAELAISYQQDLHMAVDEGLPLIRIGTLVDSPLNSLVVLEDGPIKSIADLKGRKVGFSVGGFEEALLGAMLKNVGLSLNDVELINVNWSLSPSVIQGQVDAVIGAFRNFELHQMDIVGHPGRAFFVEEEGFPAYDELIFVANKDNLDDDKLKRFLRAIEKATAYLAANPDESWQAFIEGRSELNDELNKRAWADTIPLFATKASALNEERYQVVPAYLKDYGIITEVKPVSAYAIDLFAN